MYHYIWELIIIKKIYLLIALLILLVGCNSAEKEYKDQLNEAEKRLEETQAETERLEGLTEQIDETTELIEEVQGDLGIEDDSNDDELEEDPTEYNTSEIELNIKNVVDADLNNTTITELRVNEDASVEEERYIVLVDLEWDVKNGASTTKEMLDMYSDHLAASLTDNELIYELVLFWTVPYHNENDSILKRAYENKDGGMYLEDEMKDVSVFD